MKKKRDNNIFTNRETTINNLIKDILNIKRQIDYEGINEKPIIKLGRRIEQRSNEKLSKQILEHIIARYLIDNITFPTRDELIKLMINYLGNIQKTPDYYNLQNEPIESRRLKSLYDRIGKGVNGTIYAVRTDGLKTKKNRKKLAYKEQKVGTPYNINKHIVSSILLAYYDFQPKYYNKYFMEMGMYNNKSGQRSFKNIKKIFYINTEKSLEDNIKWYILYNFTNISDQVHNLMKRVINNEFVKIDIQSFNSELKYSKMIAIFNYLEIYQESFKKKKNTIINELNKLLIIKEEFILDLILFRTERGGFDDIKKEVVASHFDCLRSSYNILKLEYKDDFKNIFNKYIYYRKNNICEYNIALSWIFLFFYKIRVFNNNLEYNDYVYMFKKKAKEIEEFANKIRKGEIEIEKKKEIKIEINEKKEENKEIKKDQKINEEIKEENKEEIKEENIIIEDINKDDEIKDEINIENNEKEKKINEESKKNFNEMGVFQEETIENIKTDNDKKYLDYKNIDKKDITKIEALDLEIINIDDINKKEEFSENLNLNNKNKNSRKNNFIESTDINKINRNQKSKPKSKSKISCWFCCGADSVDVI